MTKARREKSLWLTEFHPNVWKTFASFASFALICALKVLPLLKTFIGKTSICEKSEKTMKYFSRVTFVGYGMHAKYMMELHYDVRSIARSFNLLVICCSCSY